MTQPPKKKRQRKPKMWQVLLSTQEGGGVADLLIPANLWPEAIIWYGRVFLYDSENPSRYYEVEGPVYTAPEINGEKVINGVMEVMQ